MSRFDATTPTDRRELIESAIDAHRERSSAFCTFEPDAADVPEADGLGVPWVQCSGDRTTFDSTDRELDRAKSRLDAYDHYRIDEIRRPDDAEGCHVIVSTPGDPDLRARFVDDLFTDVFALAQDYRLWACAI